MVDSSAHRGLVPMQADQTVLHQVVSLLKVTPGKNKVDIIVLSVLLSLDQMHLGQRIFTKTKKKKKSESLF